MLTQGFAQDAVLIAQVGGRVALTGARPPGSSGVAEGDALGQRLFEPVPDRAPRTHVLRLFLRPDELFQVRVRAHELGRRQDRERVELLQPAEREPRSLPPPLVAGGAVVALA